MNMNFGANKVMKYLKKMHFEELILETFILVLMVNGIKSNGKNLMNERILIKIDMVQIIMLVLINMVLKVEHHYDFGKIKAGLIL